jgi:hypothetical protein
MHLSSSDPTFPKLPRFLSNTHIGFARKESLPPWLKLAFGMLLPACDPKNLLEY